MIRNSFVIALIVLGLSACGAQLGKSKLQDGIVLGMINTYPMIERDYERGMLLRARARVLAMKPDDSDYARAHKLYKEKIEPARLRIFTHYLRKARSLEKKKLWSEAAWAYDQAKSVTIKPERMEAKRAEMEMKMRQVRMEGLLELRRKEDRFLLTHALSFGMPKGVAGDDEIFLRKREQYMDLLDERADQTYYEGRRFLRIDRPELAWVEVESLLRLQPGSVRAVKLKAEVLEAMPKSLHIPRDQQVTKSAHSVQRMRKSPAMESVDDKQIRKALKEGRLLEAKTLALAYRRNEGKGAEALLDQVQSKIESRAAQLFEQGGRAFRQEALDNAIANWSEAVALQPEEREYVNALHRAQQLKERLTLLKGQPESSTVLETE